MSAPAFGKFASSTEPLILVDNLQETEDKFQIVNRNSTTFFVRLYSYCLANDNQLGSQEGQRRTKSTKELQVLKKYGETTDFSGNSRILDRQ